MVATRLVAKALLIDADGKLLVLTRSDSHPTLAGFYDLPGGMVEADEEPGAAVKREINEETGLDVSDATVLYATTHMARQVSYPTLLYLARCNERQPTVTLSWEHSAYEWAPMSKLAEVEPQIAPAYRQALDYIRVNDILNGF